MSDLLFQKVKCKGFLKKVWDGRFIETHPNEGYTYDCEYRDSNNPDLKIECEYCGDFDFLKTYYEHKEKEFFGFVVGYKEIVATGYLTVDTDYDFMGREHTRLGKQPKDVCQCAIVYYANNKKRFVSIEDIKIGEGA